MTQIVTIERLSGKTCAVLHEQGKMDYSIPITEEQVPWINGLKRLVNPQTEQVHSSPPAIGDEVGNEQRVRLEAAYRKYFVEVQKRQFTMTISIDDLLDFITWFRQQKEYQ